MRKYTSWQSFWAPKSLQMVTAAMKLKMLAPWKKSHNKPRQCIKKQRHYFADKSPYSQSYGFSVVMYGCESWTIKKAEHQRIGVFELWCWRRLLRVPRTARRSKQSILKEISPEYSLEGLMLKLQYFGYLMWRADPLEKTLMLGKIEGKGRRGWQRMHLQLPQLPLQWHITTFVIIQNPENKADQLGVCLRATDLEVKPRST